MKQKGFIDIVIVVGLVAVLAVGGFFLWRQQAAKPKTNPPAEQESNKPENTQSPEPVRRSQDRPSAPAPKSNVTTVELDEEFTLQIGERVKLEGKEVYLKLTGFYNQPCPQGAQCVWSGQAVHYELTVDGKVYKTSLTGNLPSDSPYMGIKKKTDYTTYATMTIHKR